MSCRSFSMELTRELWPGLSLSRGLPRESSSPSWWFPLTRLSASARVEDRDTVKVQFIIQSDIWTWIYNEPGQKDNNTSWTLASACITSMLIHATGI